VALKRYIKDFNLNLILLKDNIDRVANKVRLLSLPEKGRCV
jgi:hypothetical protein